MNTRHFRILGVAAIVLAMACTAVAASQNYALATSGSSLYIFRTQTDSAWGGRNWYDLGAGFGSTGITGVATYDNYVFVADSASNSLHIGRIESIATTPSYVSIGTVSLGDPKSSTYVKSPTAVAANENGVYVVGSSYYDGSVGHSYLAYISKTGAGWTSTSTSLIDLGQNKGMADVVMLTNGQALVAHQGGPYVGQAWVSTFFNGAKVGETTLGDNCYVPQAIAANDAGKAFIVNRVYDLTDKGSVQTYDPTSNTTGGPGKALEPFMIPGDVAAFSIGAEDFIGIIGNNGNSDEAWKVPVAGGAVDLAAKLVSSGVASSTQHQAAASADGSVFWFTSWAAGRVDAWDTANWSPVVGFSGSLGDGVNVKYITDFNPAYIPEPSAMVSLGAMLAAGIGLLRRRRM